MAKRNIIQFELRLGKDDDIAEELDKVVTIENTRSSVIRNALRSYLFRDKNTHHKEDRTPIDPPEMNIELKEVEIDDSQLNSALDDLLKF